MSNSALAALVFLQLAVILLTCRATGWVARRLGQPQVVAEMVAGFALGYSFFGWTAPGIHRALFPPDTITPLYVLSQIGLALYMFTVGLEFQRSLITRHAGRAVTVSMTGVLAPMALGGALALVIMELVLLNIALERGLITPTLFTMLAIMAIGTTVMAYPLFGLFSPERRETDLGHGAAALEHS